jgi:hypothetical protein
MQQSRNLATRQSRNLATQQARNLQNCNVVVDLLFLYLICDLLIFFKAKEAVWPLLTSVTGIRLRWMLLTAIDIK